MLTRAEKETIVNGLREKIENSNAMFLTNMIGVPSNDANEIRAKIRESNGAMVVTRNTLFARAAQGTKAEELLKGLKGPSAVAFAFEDAPGVAKVIYDSGKNFEQIELRGGFLGDQALEAADVVALAKLPSKDQMLSTLLATFNAPISAFARLLNTIKDKVEETGGETPASIIPAASEGNAETNETEA